MHRGVADDLTYGAHDHEQRKKNRSNEKTAVKTSGQVSKKVFLILLDLIHMFMENLLHSLSPVEEILLNGIWSLPSSDAEHL